MTAGDAGEGRTDELREELLESRLLLGILLATAFSLVGLIAGAGIGALWFVPAGSGLAGPAIAMAYGMGGMALGVVCAILTARALSLPALRRTVVASSVLAFVGVTALGYRVYRIDRDRRSAGLTSPDSATANPLRAPYRVRIEVDPAGTARPGPDAVEMSVEHGPDGAIVAWTTRGERALRCEAPLVGPETVAVAAQLQRFAARMATGTGACSGNSGGGPDWYRIDWVGSFRPEAAAAGAVAIDAECHGSSAGARELIEVVAAIVTRAEPVATCGPATRGFADAGGAR